MNTKGHKPAENHPWKQCISASGAAKDKRKKELIKRLTLMKQQMKKIN